MKLQHYCLFVCFTLLSTYSYCQSELIKPLPVKGDWEVLHKNIPVSGEIRVGIVSLFEEAKVAKQFFLLLPESDAKTVCVSITSNDGRYTGSREYQVAGKKPGVYAFSWPSVYYNDFREYSTLELTIMARLDGCDEESNDFLVSSWSENVDQGNISVFLNSERRSRIMVRDKETRKINPFPCNTLEGPSNVAFNCSCIIPRNVITENCEVYVEQRVRRGPNFSFVRYPLNIKL